MFKLTKKRHTPSSTQVSVVREKVGFANHQICSVFDDGDDHGFIYTTANKDSTEHAELIVFDVPRSQAEHMLEFLSKKIGKGSPMKVGQPITGLGFHFVVREVANQAMQDRIALNYFGCLPSTERLVVLSPQFPGAKEWGGKPTAPQGKTDLRDRIYSKLAGLGMVIRAVDGDFDNLFEENFRVVSLYKALTHPHWNVDFYMDFKPKELTYLQKNIGYFAQLFAPVARKPFTEADEQEIQSLGFACIKLDDETRLASSDFKRISQSITAAMPTRSRT